MIAIAQQNPRFRRGQIVRHLKYGYRGVVVEINSRCEAPDEWYQRNQTQPDRYQPWYHVIIDGQLTTTYAAQTSLMADDCADPIANPLVERFFDELTDEGYVRNSRPWPGWESV